MPDKKKPDNPNYDRVVRYYDFLSAVVFGNSRMRSQTCLLHFLKNNDRILIAGGGSGKILEEIDRCGCSHLEVVYAEASAKMIRRAKQRSLSNLIVHFVEGGVEQVSPASRFDIVFTPFIFDNFSNEAAALLFSSLHQRLSPGGYWLHADFHVNRSSSLWKKALLQTMYAFFRLTTGVQTNQLPDIRRLFQQQAYRQKFQQWHYRRFIRSEVWQKPREQPPGKSYIAIYEPSSSRENHRMPPGCHAGLEKDDTYGAKSIVPKRPAESRI